MFGSLKNRFFGGSSETPPTKKDNIHHSRLKETLQEDFGEDRLQASRSFTSAASYERLDSDFGSDFKDISHGSSRQAQFDEKLGR